MKKPTMGTVIKQMEIDFEVEPAKEPEPAQESEEEMDTEVEETTENKEPTILNKWKQWLNNLMNVVTE